MAKKNLASLSSDELWSEMQRIQAAKARLDEEQEAVRAVFDSRRREERIDTLISGLSDEEIQAVVARVGGDG